MSHYYLDSDLYRINFGYDNCLKGFWLIIYFSKSNKAFPPGDNSMPLFNSIVDWPKGIMGIADLKFVLQMYGERIPVHDLSHLYGEAENCGYFSTLNKNEFSYSGQEIPFNVSSPSIKNFLKKSMRRLMGIFRISLKAQRAFKQKY